jgi:hypothetical protein
MIFIEKIILLVNLYADNAGRLPPSPDLTNGKRRGSSRLPIGQPLIGILEPLEGLRGTRVRVLIRVNLFTEVRKQLVQKKEAAKEHRRRRRPAPALRRRSGYPASCRRPSAGVEPTTKTLPIWGEDRRGAARAAATEAPIVATEGRSRAASAAAGKTRRRQRIHD